MRLKQITTLILGAFVALCVVSLAAKVLRKGDQEATWRSWPDGPEAPAALTDEPLSLPPLVDGVIVYYFHSAVRCATCENIEAFAREAVQSGFAAQLKSGRLRMRVIDYQRPGNEHFVSDYQLVAPAVVLVGVRGGVEEHWQNLSEVWEFANNKDAFCKFMKEKISIFLQGPGPAASR